MTNLPSRFDSWTRWHALFTLVSLAAAVFFGSPWFTALCGLLSFVELCRLGRGRWTDSGRFGWANAVTALRVAIVAAAAVWLHRAPGHVLAAIALFVLALDGFDGFVARRTGAASAFGALFDGEADAFFVLLLELELYQSGVLPAWILSTGVLRCAQVLLRAVVPARRPDVPRTRFGRWAFLGLVTGLVAALVLRNPLGQIPAALGTLLVLASLARSFYESYAPHG